MPLTLAVASAAKTVTMAFLEKTRGRGWWGSNTCADYYSELDASDNPFNWIRVLPCMSTGAQNATGYDHAGQYECSLLAALYPEAVQLDKLSQSDEWFIQQARLATPGYGHKMIELSLQDLETRIFGETGTTEQ